jgi:hydrogenase maturation protease
MTQAPCAVELTPTGYLVLRAEVASRFFPHDTLLVFPRDRELWLLPTRGAAAGGLLLKQRNPMGDRAVLVREVVGDSAPTGELPAIWDDRQGALRVALIPIGSDHMA